MTDATHPIAPAPLSLVSETPTLGSRALFPDLKAHAYLAHAAISPASSLVRAAVQACAKTVAEVGVGSFPLYMNQRERLRESAAKLVNVPSASVALSGGCTRGITDLALALPWKEGDTLLTYHGEFPANVNPWQVAARSRGAQVELFDLPPSTDPECEQLIVEQLDARLKTGGVPFVAVSAVQFQTGLRMPLRQMSEVCRRHGARFFVDGIQACGVVPLDLAKWGVDAFFVGAHKWLLGLEGAGFAYYSPELMADLSPLTVGWLSYPGAEKFLFQGAGHLHYDRQLHEGPRVFEGSTVNSSGFAALEAGVDLLSSLGVPAVYEHVQTYHDAVVPKLEALGFSCLRAVDPELRSGIASFRPPEGVEVPVLAARLRERGVTISIPDGLVRLAPHYCNSLDEVEMVATAFAEVLQSLRV